MSKYQNIEKLGLSAISIDGFPAFVSADNLELILKSAQVVYGSPDTPSDQLAWSGTQLDCDTHKAILLNIEPLKKKTKAEAALELLSEITNDGFHLPNNADLIVQAKLILEMKDEV